MRNAQTFTEWLPCVVFAVAAIVLFLVPTHSNVQTTPSPIVSPDDLLTTAARQPLGHPPITKINGFDRDCQDCHSIFKSKKEHNDGKLQHGHIKLQHGLNSDCLNCHLEKDRNLLRLHSNKSITFDKSEVLCAQCHGTTFRDWKNGSHGRVQGSWLEHSEDRTRLTCVACHDPHRPAFPGIAPLPGPQTLRMGKPNGYHAHYRSSLMEWLNQDEQDDEEDEEEHAHE